MTMKHVMVGVLFGCLGMTLACSQKEDDLKQQVPPGSKITREYLLSHGFNESDDSPATFTREHVRLQDVLRDLGCPLAALHPTVNQDSHSDKRTADVQGIYVIVDAEVFDNKDYVGKHSLDNPDAICTVRVFLKQIPERKYLKTDSVPRLRIKSVTVPEDGAKSLHVTFELAATGQKPLAIAKHDFLSSLTGTNLPSYPILGVGFPDEAPEIISLSPSKPIVLRVTVPLDAGVPSGEYVLRIRIGSIKSRGPQRFDYDWQGREYLSENFKFVIK
jgi:hypothetical protein